MTTFTLSMVGGAIAGLLGVYFGGLGGLFAVILGEVVIGIAVSDAV